MEEKGINSIKDNMDKEEIFLLEIESFQELYDLLKEGKYNTKKLEKDFQNFCLETEKNNYICEKNEKNKIINGQSLFNKFKLSQNLFDFQISMSDLIIKYYKFLINIKPNNKKEYNILNNIFEIFSEINKNNLIMRNIQCLIDNGILYNYNNNFFIFLLDINDKYFKQLFSFFDLKKYFLSSIDNINIFISKLNEIINSYKEEEKQFLFIRKITNLITEIFILFENDKEKNNNEEINIIKLYKEKIIDSINKEKLFEIFINDKEFLSHMDIFLNLIKLFPDELDKQINILINKKEKLITKSVMKFILKNAKVLNKYIKESTLNLLNNISIENSFKFHLNQYISGKDRLINIYYKYKDHENIIKLLIKYLLENNKKEQAKLIEENKYNEKDEYELEEKFIEENNSNKYFKLPEDYKIYYISAEENNINESLKILENIINNNLNSDKYMGIDTEWKSSNNFYEQYQENINNSNNNLADIIQIAGINHGFIFDVKSINKNEEIKEKIKKIFFDTKFIGFEFRNDYVKIGQFFKEIIYKNKFIELSNVYKERLNKRTPELKSITLEFFGKELDKRDQISDWSKRPLLQNQIIYGILDAYVLILIYNKLNS